MTRRSLRPSTSLADRTCSGDMKLAVPSTESPRVRASESSAGAVAMPKSSTLSSATPSKRLVTKRFAGLMSRCTMPRAWASARAAQAWMT